MTDWLDAEQVRLYQSQELWRRDGAPSPEMLRACTALSIVLAIAALPERQVVEAGTAHRIWLACRAAVGEETTKERK